MNTQATRITIARISNTGAVQTALFGSMTGNVNGSSQFTGDISNITLQDITSATSMAMGITVVNLNNLDIVPVLNVTNATIDNIITSTGVPITIPLLAAAAGAENVNDTARSELNARNVLISRGTGSSASCGVVDISALTGGAGIGTGTISSSGGNLSDDASCTPYFTEPTDQHNLGNLASTLGSLSDNGGHIPTIALLEGSPAIDAGVVAPGLAVDARLAVRPQGAAYDSGAYESPFSRAANDSNQTNLAQTGGSQILLVVTGGILLLVSVFYLIIARRATV